MSRDDYGERANIWTWIGAVVAWICEPIFKGLMWITERILR